MAVCKGAHVLCQTFRQFGVFRLVPESASPFMGLHSHGTPSLPSCRFSQNIGVGLRRTFDGRRSFSTTSVVENDKTPEKPTFSLADKIMQAKVESEETKKDSSGAGTGAKEAGAGKGTTEEGKPKGPQPMSKWQKIGYTFFGVTFLGAIVTNAILFSLPDRDEDGNNIPDEFSELPFYSQYYRRLKNKIFQTKKDLEEPFSDKLLPEPLPEPYYQPKYTVFLELTGLLVHASWTHKYGWRFQKRPGVDIFLSQVGYPNFELVIYTTENAMMFYPIIDGLDPNNQYIMYRLFRDATRYVNGMRIKDLKSVNRDPKRIIVVDWNKESVTLQPENGLLLKKWEGDNTDRQLIGLAQLLQAIKQSDVDDVREVLEYYRQFDDPIEAFRENQRKLQSEMSASEERRQKELQSKRSSFLSGITSSFVQRKSI